MRRPIVFLMSLLLLMSAVPFTALAVQEPSDVRSPNAQFVTAGPAAAPVITKQPVSVSVSIGETFTLSVAADNADSYEWRFIEPGSSQYPDIIVKSNATVTGQGTDTLTVTPKENWNGGWFGGSGVGIYCIVTNANGSTASEMAEVTIKREPGPAPVITKQPVSVEGSAGKTFTVSVAAENADTYEWCFADPFGNLYAEFMIGEYAEVSGQGTPVLSVTPNQEWTQTWLLKGGVRIYCNVANANGSVASDAAVITVNPTAPIIKKNPEPVVASIGEPFTVTVNAEYADTYEWRFINPGYYQYADTIVNRNATVTGQGTNTLTVTPNANWIDGWYAGVGICCVVTNAYGTTESELAEITLMPVAEVGGCVFTDVKTSDWFYSDVVYAYKTGLIDGKSPTLYKPADNMTIAEAIKLASCMHQLTSTGKVTLTNGDTNWYDSYVQYAKENGISWNYSNYNAPVTREEYVHIFYSALPESGYKAINSVTSIPDVTSDSPYYAEILTFYNAGILTGNNKQGKFLPESNIKRSEVAAVLTRMMDDSARKTFTLVP